LAEERRGERGDGEHAGDLRPGGLPGRRPHREGELAPDDAGRLLVVGQVDGEEVALGDEL
jgi:hypothetical protein